MAISNDSISLCGTNKSKSLPVELILMIATFLGRQDFMRLACSCGTLQNVLSLQLYKRDIREWDSHAMYVGCREGNADMIRAAAAHGEQIDHRFEYLHLFYGWEYNTGWSKSPSRFRRRALDPQPYLSPANLAIHYGSLNAVRCLIELGLDINKPSISGTSLLHYVCNHQLQIWCADQFVELLIQQGASVDQRDSNGKTPLHLLCKNHYMQQFGTCFTMLVQHGADMRAPDRDQKTPEMLLRQKFHIPGFYSLPRHNDKVGWATFGRILEDNASRPESGDSSEQLIAVIHQLWAEEIIKDCPGARPQGEIGHIKSIMSWVSTWPYG